MAEIIVQNLVLGMVATNTYFLMNPETKEMLLADQTSGLFFFSIFFSCSCV